MLIALHKPPDTGDIDTAEYNQTKNSQLSTLALCALQVLILLPIVQLIT